MRQDSGSTPSAQGEQKTTTGLTLMNKVSLVRGKCCLLSSDRANSTVYTYWFSYKVFIFPYFPAIPHKNKVNYSQEHAKQPLFRLRETSSGIGYIIHSQGAVCCEYSRFGFLVMCWPPLVVCGKYTCKSALTLNEGHEIWWYVWCV